MLKATQKFSVKSGGQQMTFDYFGPRQFSTFQSNFFKEVL